MEVDDRYAEKYRKCLRCFKQFWSEHAANRICKPCQSGLRSVNRRDIPTESPTDPDTQEDTSI